MTVSRSLRTPRAAGVAGVLFAVLLTTALVLLRLAARSEAGLSNAKLAMVPQLVPFAGIAFLWFIGVVRHRIGEREDRFFATVFLGSGLLFVATLFAASGVFSGVLANVASTRPVAPMEALVLNLNIASVILHMYVMRMAAVFTISTATIGLRTGFLPRWLGFSGYTIAVILLLGIKVTLWVELLFPFWILLLSIYILIETFSGRPAYRELEHTTLGTATD
jgi:hypothetical protein